MRDAGLCLVGELTAPGSPMRGLRSDPALIRRLAICVNGGTVIPVIRQTGHRQKQLSQDLTEGGDVRKSMQTERLVRTRVRRDVIVPNLPFKLWIPAGCETEH